VISEFSGVWLTTRRIRDDSWKIKKGGDSQADRLTPSSNEDGLTIWEKRFVILLLTKKAGNPGDVLVDLTKKSRFLGYVVGRYVLLDSVSGPVPLSLSFLSKRQR